jgi:hypothetical protein
MADFSRSLEEAAFPSLQPGQGGLVSYSSCLLPDYKLFCICIFLITSFLIEKPPIFSVPLFFQILFGDKAQGS